MAATNDRGLRNAESTQRLRRLVARLGDADLLHSLGGGWTVGFALAHLAFWDARQVAALQRFVRGEPFPLEDLATNAALESIAAAFDSTAVGEAAVAAADELDRIVERLSAEQIDALRESGKTYAIERAPHRNEHMRQIEDVVG
ncbi:MAG: DinB family protein [Chloroflexi bacterium]|nr:DinB family protein [Chloroflexota bacterium]